MRKLVAMLAITLVLLSGTPVQAYAVLAHEAIIDAAWDTEIQPMLLKRFPQSTPDELRKAHGYAYGGAIIQDLGYYPYGSHLFSDLVHYVRSGDFIQALLRDSQDLNEYAFALGALAHYAADNEGHRLATNRAVPLLYPRLRRKYGDTITYADNPVAHLKTEFAFDVVQVARGKYAPDGYHDFIGFEVAKSLLERAFKDTYSLELQSVFGDLDHALGTYRWSVSSVIPAMTKVAWQAKKDDIEKLIPGITRKRFHYHMPRREYEREWGKSYRKPGFGTRVLAFFIRIIPKIGPLKTLDFRTPTPETEKMFLNSLHVTREKYRSLLSDLESGHLQLPNTNFDVGEVTNAGEYRLADSTYADLLDRLAEQHFAQVDPQLRANILDYYENLGGPIETKKHRKEWSKVLRELDELKCDTEETSTADTPSESKPAAQSCSEQQTEPGLL